MLRTSCLILSFFLSLHLFAQDTYTIDIRQYTTEDGLSDNAVYAIAKDGRGVVWIGTKFGLNRFDGRSFKTFYVQDGLSSNTVTNIYKLDSTHLWLFNQGLDVMNVLTEEILPFEKYYGAQLPFRLKEVEIPLISNGHVFFKLLDGRHFVFTPGDGFKHLPFFLPGELPLARLPDGRYLTRTADLRDCSMDLTLRGKEGKQQAKVVNLPVCAVKYFEDEDPGTITLVIERKTASLEHEFWKYDTALQRIQEIEVPESDSLRYATIGLDYAAHWNAYWFADKNTVKLVDITNGSTARVIFEFSNKGEKVFNFSAGRELIEDNRIWQASSDGLYLIELNKNRFRNILNTFGQPLHIRGITRAQDKLFYASNKGVFESGLDLKIKEKPFLPFGLAILKGKDGSIWSGNNKIIFHKSLNSSSLQQYHILTNEYWSIYEDYKGRIWFSQDGLFVLNPAAATVDTVKCNEFKELAHCTVYFFYPQNDTSILLCTTLGLFEFHPDKGIMARYWSGGTGKYYLPVNDFRHLYHDKKAGIFWLATGQRGLVRWQPATQESRVFTFPEAGSNAVHGVYADDFGHLWMPTENGIIQFSTSTFQFTRYSTKEGLQANEFNRIAHFQDTDGTLYFGSVDGATVFHPKDFKDELSKKYNLPVAVVEVQQYTQRANALENLTAQFATNNYLTISPGDRYCILTVSLKDAFWNDKNTRFFYQLKNKDKEWIALKSNEITLGSLPYGQQTLRVKAMLPNGRFSENILEIPIRVKRPFYLQAWFLLLLLVATVVSALLFIHYRTLKLNKDKITLENTVKERTLTIRQQTEELKQLDLAKTRFFSNVTHELRTPLTLILGPARQLLQAETRPVHRQKLTSIVNNAHHLLGLINQLLDLSKLEGGKMQVVFHHGDIVTYTEGLVQLFLPLAEQKQQQLRFFSSEDFWETDFDQDKWNKIIFNLLSNAIKFTPEGGSIQLDLASGQDEEQEHIHLLVRDTGVGIAPEQLPQIFNRFYQADDSSTRTHEGTGIGLALVKELVELQNGSISVDSELGKGTTFEVKIPVAQQQEAAPLKEVQLLPSMADSMLIENGSQPTEQPSHSTEDQLEILIIEDNAALRKYIRSCLDSTRYRVTMAADGEDGIAEALATVPDLIITDIMMPRKDGFEVVEAVRNHLSTSHIPIIILSAKAALESRLKGLERGADAYLTKPFSPEELALRVRKLIEMRQSLQQRYQQNGHLDTELAGSELAEDYQKEDDFIVALKAFIIENMAETDLSVTTISEHFSMNRTQLYRKVKALTDETVVSLLQKVRLEAAMDLIKENKLTVSEIAYQTGFSSPSYFSTVFKNAYGKNPSEIN
ncbi:MAG: response regulator [Lewinellaceae bacterium]|nr:response regulator [Lewinellaceae bacterium]